MQGTLKLVMVLHSHQPVGNFDHVIKKAYVDCYLPFLETFAKFPGIRLSLHYSGCLLEWLEKHHPEYFDLLRDGIAAGRWDMVGGGMQEPILPMLPERDRQGQLRAMADYIEERFGTRPEGMWLAERVWEQALVTTIANAGFTACCLDDSHFKNAGYTDEELRGGFVAEDQGNVVRVFPGSEKLRYIIPFGGVGEVIDYLKSLADESGERTVVYADDGEKFGVWPETHKHCFTAGWLGEFLEALSAESSWLKTITLSEAAELQPVGAAYLPDASYREMGEWALPARRAADLHAAVKELEGNEFFEKIRGQLRGGSWRGFRVKYPEARRMYAKMLHVSEQLATAGKARGKKKLSAAKLEEARAELFRGQCNCPYWHGVFGGLYLPHLRHGVQSALIRAQNIVETPAGTPRLLVDKRDFDRDGFQELYLSNEYLGLYFTPHRGGRLYHFDARDVRMNILDTLARRYEDYHDKVHLAVVERSEEDDSAGEESSGEHGNGDDEAQSIHERIIAKEADLENLLHYDPDPRESLADHLFARLPSPEELEAAVGGRGHPAFLRAPYSVERFGVGKGKNRTATLVMSREAEADGICRLLVRKTVVVGASDSGFTIKYEATNTGISRIDAYFGVEFNYALMAGDAFDRYYRHDGSINAGPLMTMADFGERQYIELVDEYNDLRLRLEFFKDPLLVMVFPVRTVSQSEGGFESVYQSSAVFAFRRLELEPSGTAFWEMRQEIGRCR